MTTLSIMLIKKLKATIALKCFAKLFKQYILLNIKREMSQYSSSKWRINPKLAEWT